MSARARPAPAPARSRQAAAPAARARIPKAVDAVLATAGAPLAPPLRGDLADRLAIDLSGIPPYRRAAPAAVAREDHPDERLAERLSQGTSLPARAGREVGPLARIRVHVGPLADAAARALSARAFAIDGHLVFGAGAWQPERACGRDLIAHEVAHAARPGPAGTLWRKALPDGSSDADVVTPTDVAADQAEADQAKADESDDETEASTATSEAIPPAPPSPSPTAGPAAKAAALPMVAPDAGAQAPTASRQKQVADLGTGDLALVDDELAEHERWGAAAATVGAAESAQRAEFAAEAAGAGAIKGVTGALQSTAGMKEGKFDVETALKSPVAVKVAEKLIEKAAIASAVRLGAKAGAFKGIPGIGPMVGGAMAAYDLAKRDWGKTGNAVAGFGKGADIYEQLANTIESVSTVLEVLTQVANVIAGILGVIVVVSWVAAVASGGALGPVAALLSAIAIKIGVVTMIIDAINALGLKPMITAFRALHAFASEADPRDVVAQGNAIEESAGASTGFITGLAANKALDKGIHMASEPRPPKVPEHPTPPAKGGEGPHVKAEPPLVEGGPGKGAVEGSPPAAPESGPDRPSAPSEGEKAGGAPAKAEGKALPDPSLPSSAEPDPAQAGKTSTSEVSNGPAGGDDMSGGGKKSGPVDERSFADMNDIIDEMDKGGFGDKRAAQEAAVRGNEPARREVSAKQARREANAGAKRAAKLLGIGGDVQAGHTQASRHTSESGAPREQTNDPATFQALHSRKGKGLDITVTSVDPKTGEVTQKVRTRHTAQEGLIDTAVARSRAASGGKLTAQGQAHAGAEVLWRTEGTGFDQREVVQKRGGGLFDERSAIEKNKAVQEYRRRRTEQQASPKAVDTTPLAQESAGVAGSDTGSQPATTPVSAAMVEPTGKGLLSVDANAVPDAATAPKEAAVAGDAAPPQARETASGGGKPPGGDGTPPRGGDGPGQDHPGISEIERERLETIGERSRIAGRGRLVEDIYQKPSEQRPIAQRRDEKVPGRSEVSQRVKDSQRARARKRFGKVMQEALQDESKHTELTLKTRDYLTPEQQEFVRDTGKLPRGVEFHHLMTIADFPEFGDRPETGLGLPSEVHKREGHAGDPTKPLETLTFLDHAAEDEPGFTLDPEARKGHRAKQRDIAEGSGATPERLGGIDVDLIKERKGKIAKLKGRRIPKPGDAAEIQRLEAEIQTIEKLIAAKKNPPGGAPPPSPTSSPASPPAKSEAPPEPVVAPAADPEPPAQAPDAPPPSAHEDRSPPPAPPLPQAAGDAPLASPSAAPSQVETPAHSAALRAPPRPVKPPPSSPPTAGPQEPAPPEPPASKPLAGPKPQSLPPPRSIKSTEPITERVDPPYEPPPATPEEIVSLRNQVIDTLAERASHERFADAMGQQERHHAANAKPIGDMKAKTGEAIGATDAHETAVKHRQEALERKTAEEEKVREHIDDYRTRWTEVAGLKLMLTGVQKFTGLAAALPDEPSPVLSFKNGFLKINRDSTKFVGKLNEAQTAMAAQHAEGEQRRAGAKADGQTLDRTGEKAVASKAALDSAEETAANVETANTERRDEAKSDKDASRQAAAALAAQARQKQKRADGLAAAMQSWAQDHRKTRLDAIEQTRKRLEAQGWKVTETSEG